MKCFLTIALLLSAPLVFARSHKISPDTGAGLSKECSLALDVNIYHPRKIRNRFEGYDLGHCLGVVEATYANTSGSDFCPPNNYPLNSTLELVIKFVKDHPELQDKYSADIVRWALSDKFPCPVKDRSGEDDSQAKENP